MAYSSNPSITNALGKPVVEQKQDFFVLFEGAFSTTPEIIDQTSYKLTYVVDGQGNISKPAEQQPSSFNVLQNFENDKNVTVILDQATTENSNLAGVKRITAIGQPVPYVFSSNGISSESYEDRLVFRPPGAPPSGAYEPMSSYLGNTGAPTPSQNEAYDILNFSETNALGLDLYHQGVFIGQTGSLVTQADTLNYNSLTQPDPAAAIISSSGQYLLNSIAPEFQYLDLYIAFEYDPNTFFYQYNWSNGYQFQFGIQIGSLEDDNWSTIKMTATSVNDFSDSTTLFVNPNITQITNQMSVDSNSGIITINSPSTYNRSITFPSQRITQQQINEAPQRSDGKRDIRIVWAHSDAELNWQTQWTPTIKNPQLIINSQGPLPDNYFTAILPDGQTNAPSFWETASIDGGGTIKNKWLTASAKLSEFYGDFYVSTTTQNQFGYPNPNITFAPRPGDKIRFQFNPDTLFNIYGVKTPGENNGRLALLLDGLPETASLDNFILYRIDDSLAADMILDVKKTVTIGDPENPFTGIILPQYPSDNIVKNLDSIIEKLKVEGIVKN